MTRLLSEATRVSGQGEGPWIPATNPLKGGKNFGKWGLGGIVHIYMTRLVLGSAGARETPFMGVAVAWNLREHMKPRTTRAALSKGFVEVNTAPVVSVGPIAMRETLGRNQ
jgi:hypothetical protein